MKYLPSGGRQLALDIVLIIVGLAFCWPLLMLSAAGEIGLVDWSILHYFDGCLRQSISTYHELPLWNPYQLGGTPLWADYTARASIYSWLILLFGEVDGYRLEITAFYCLGMLGMVRYAVRSGLRTAAALVVTALFFLHPWLVHSLINCLADDYNILLLPWLLLGYQRALATGRLSVLAVFILASFIVNYGAIHYFHSLLFLGVVSVCATGPHAVRARIWLTTAVGALALGAVKWLPAADLFTVHTRLVVEQTGIAAGELINIMLPAGVADDRGLAINVLWGGLLLAGLCRVPGPFRFAPLCILLFGIAAVGDRGFPWWQEVTTRLPFIAELRTTHYTTHYLLFALVLLAGVGLQRFLVACRKAKFSSLIMLGLCGLAVAHAWFAQQPRWLSVRRAAMPVIETDGRGIQYTRLHELPLAHPVNRNILQSLAAGRGGWREIAQYACLANRFGAIEAFDPSLLGSVDEPEIPRAGFTRAAGVGEAAYRGEEYLQQGTGTISVIRKTMNEFAYAVAADSSARLVVNQNFFPGWQVSLDGAPAEPVIPHAGLLAADIPPGEHTLRFAYRPVLVMLGAAVSLLTALFLGGLALCRRRHTAAYAGGRFK